MISIKKQFLLVFLLVFSVYACAGLRKGTRKTETDTAENLETKEISVEEEKPYHSVSDYELKTETIDLFEKHAKRKKQKIIPSSLNARIEFLREKTEELDQKIDALYKFHIEDEKALHTLKTRQRQDSQMTEEKFMLFSRQIHGLDEEYARRLNIQRTQDVVDEKELYEKAQRLYRSGNYIDAVIVFKKYINSFPKSTLADNAQYWIGEGYYSQRDYRRAAEEFEKVADFPDDSKIPDASLKKGYCYFNMKKYTEARKIFSQIVDKYSDDKAEYAIVDSAKRKLAAIKGKR